MSQALEKAFHLRIKQFASKRLQGMTMGAFREVLGMQAPADGTPPLDVVLEAPGLTRYAPAPPPGGMIRTKAGTWVTVEDAHEYADSQYNKGFATGQGGWSFFEHLSRQAEWSRNTFGPGQRTKGIIDHITKELGEVAADPLDLKEWIDIVILGLDGAWRVGASPQQIIDALKAKQAKNEGRNWPDWRTADPDKAIEHDRTGE
jgi:hypothetical protein